MRAGATATGVVPVALIGVELPFQPAGITAAAAGTANGSRRDPFNHKVVQFEAAEAPEGFKDPQAGESASVTFVEPGSRAFVCTFHPNMKGTVVVR